MHTQHSSLRGTHHPVGGPDFYVNLYSKALQRVHDPRSALGVTITRDLGAYLVVGAGSKFDASRELPATEAVIYSSERARNESSGQVTGGGAVAAVVGVDGSFTFVERGERTGYEMFRSSGYPSYWASYKR